MEFHSFLYLLKLVATHLNGLAFELPATDERGLLLPPFLLLGDALPDLGLYFYSSASCFSCSILSFRFSIILRPFFFYDEPFSPITALIRCCLLCLWTNNEKEMSLLPISPEVSFLKKLVISRVPSSLSAFLMIPRNSSNSIMPDPSASTYSTMVSTSPTVSAKPSPINGSCSSGTPMDIE
jgi:hypothetical protein